MTQEDFNKFFEWRDKFSEEIGDKYVRLSEEEKVAYLFAFFFTAPHLAASTIADQSIVESFSNYAQRMCIHLANCGYDMIKKRTESTNKQG